MIAANIQSFSRSVIYSTVSQGHIFQPTRPKFLSIRPNNRAKCRSYCCLWDPPAALGISSKQQVNCYLVISGLSHPQTYTKDFCHSWHWAVEVARHWQQDSEGRIPLHLLYAVRQASQREARWRAVSLNGSWMHPAGSLAGRLGAEARRSGELHESLNGKLRSTRFSLFSHQPRSDFQALIYLNLAPKSAMTIKVIKIPLFFSLSF